MFNKTTKNRDIDGFYVKQTPVKFIEDMSVSAGAFRMMMLIMSDSDRFTIYLTNLANRMEVSYSTSKRYMTELIAANYVYKKRVDGQWIYHVFFNKLTPDAIVIPNNTKKLVHNVVV